MSWFVLSRILFLSLLFLNLAVAFTVNPTVSSSSVTRGSSSSCPSNTASSLSSSATEHSTKMAPKIPVWFQHEISVTAPSRGCHIITDKIQKAISGDLSQIKIGMCNLFIQHTSASLTINENADPEVRR